MTLIIYVSRIVKPVDHLRIMQVRKRKEIDRPFLKCCLRVKFGKERPKPSVRDLILFDSGPLEFRPESRNMINDLLSAFGQTRSKRWIDARKLPIESVQLGIDLLFDLRKDKGCRRIDNSLNNIRQNTIETPEKISEAQVVFF